MSKGAMMGTEPIYLIMSACLIALGLYFLVMSRHRIRQLMAVNILGSGIFVAFVAVSPTVDGMADPVPQAMVVTGIVVAVSATALGLVLIRRIPEGESTDE
jgi:multicomponent Na+:H+ antiporter subunit C